MSGEAFITVDDLEQFTGTEIDDAQGQFACDAACDVIRNIIGTEVIAEDDVTAALDGNGTDSLLLPSPPVREVASVLECDVALVESTDYLVMWGAGALVRKCGRWQVGRGNVVVTYSRGFLLTEDYPGSVTLPDDIRLVALQLASRILASAGDPGGMTRETIGGYTYERASGSDAMKPTEGEAAILGRYRPVGVA